MTGRSVRVLLTCLVLLAMASPSFAARRSALAGNLLIQDADDVFAFPHLVSMQKRTVTFDFGTSQGLGSGGMVFGNEAWTLGAFAHRSDFLGALPDAFFTRGDIDHIGNGTDELHAPPLGVGVDIGPAPLNWIDVLFGGQAGDMPYGLRFSVARGNDDPPNLPGPPEVEVGSDVTAFNVVLGARVPALWNTDASVEFAYATADSSDATAKTEESPFHLGVAVRRTATEESDALSLGWVGLFDLNSGSTDRTPPAPAAASSTDHTSFDIVAGAGPVYKPNDRTNVAMYGVFTYRTEKDESTAQTDTHSELTIPGWNIAAEVEVASWLQFRAGLRSAFVFVDHHVEPTSGTETHDKDNLLRYGWTSGIGLKFDNLRVDGYLNPSVLTTGTDLLGDSSQLFGLLSTSYSF